MSNVLPDSRSTAHRGSISVKGVDYEPVYCANCGKRYGLVPSSMITHVTALCDDGCAGKWGDLAHTYVDADAAFRANANEAVADVSSRLGRPVTLAELAVMAEASTGPIAALAKDWEARVSLVR